jgi:diguanylate cyclase (GGDEF)-like protein/PAS domain S-box-containing protein
MHIRDLSIRTNLVLLILFASGFAVLLASIGFAIYERHSLRGSAERELTALADSVGANSAASLAFNDRQTGREMLTALATEPHVLAAFLYDTGGELFAEYRRPGASEKILRPAWRADGPVFDKRTLTLFRTVYLDKERTGSIAIVFDLSEFQSRLISYAKIAACVLFLAVFATFLATARFAHSISDPLVQLAAIAHRITREKDYSVRAAIPAGGETARLIDSFNNMLSRIETREQALQNALTSLKESEERYALAARGANDGLWDWNLVSNKIYFSPRWNLMLGCSPDEDWSDPDEWFSRIHPSDRDRVRAELEDHCNGNSAEFVSEYRMRHKSEGYIWALSRGIAVRDGSGKAIRIAGSQTDITEGKIADPLTQIPNRLYLLDRLESSIETANQQKSRFAVLFIDLDQFKIVNDSLGHAAGDELLIDFAGRLRGCLRTSHGADGVAPSVAARIGGDEFAVLLTHIDRDTDAAAVANRILKRVSEPFHFEGRRIFVAASIGIAFNDSGVTPEDLLRNADTAMYAAKTRGKARYEFFDKEMRERAISRFEIETGLRKALDVGQLILHYQPVVRLSDGQIRGFEALVRWNHPERGMIPPGQFIPIAEESDLIVQIGRWVLRESCQQMAEWQRVLAPPAPLTMHVNVSSRQLSDPRLIEDVSGALAESGLNPNCLALEMTESSIMGNTTQTLNIFNQLRAMNVRLEIDDFGTGYSSLSYLQRLPFRALKIDRSFIRDLSTDGGSVDIIRAVLELARSLKMEVIVEGVETEDQLCKLHELGPDYLQGFLISKPVEASAAEELYRQTRGITAVAAA